MKEELDRHELPIQSVYQRGQNCTATVPIHLEILDLPGEVRSNRKLVEEAREIVSEWYNKDMEYYLRVLGEDSLDMPWLRGYERFQDDWILEAEPDNHGFLKLIFKENMSTHSIQYTRVPIVLMNQKNELGEFITPEYCQSKGWAEMVQRNINNPEWINMSPEKMLKCGVKSDVTSFDLEKGIVEVVAKGFCSDYHNNMARTLLLRDFAVFYLNKLLAIAKTYPEQN